MQTGLRAVFRSRVLSTPLQWRTAPAPQVMRASALRIRTLHIKRYTVEHEVVNFDDATGVGIVSITDHAQSVLGDVVFVELPAVGTTFAQGDQIGAVESVKAASDIYAPVSGTVEEINENLSSEPGLLNKSAEDKGWLCKIKLSDPSEVDKLMTEEEYKQTYEE
ncbi:glycine cleavage H-protein-domain-containing protein [Flammula alnicola]|nr:glycine cleavage H-protein-domain-containing protein [Flammula alnicola]